MFGLSRKNQRAAEWQDMDPAVLLTAAYSLLDILNTVVQSHFHLVVSPGSDISSQYLTKLLDTATKLKSACKLRELEQFAESVETDAAAFGEWQREQVDDLVSQFANGLKNLIVTANAAVDDQTLARHGLSDIQTRLESIKECNDITLIKETLTTQVEAARALIQRQRIAEQLRRQEIAAETAELEQRLETARAASHTDHLTSIGNRAAFDYAAAATVQQVRLGNGPYSLALIDLDDFKHINDTFGHPAGDAVLNSVAGLLRTHLGKTSFLGRIGGDEFAIIYPGKIEGLHKSLNNALLQLRRSTITVPSKASLVETRVGFSAGLAVFRGDCMITSIIRAADEALYSSKKSGKGQIQVFDERAAA